ncbi:oxygen-independent coproporphyrinogen III oxidase [Alteromonas sp. 1_MG-2023]|uniref:oxygen-independent coproporphyrinogen III oxidase n=1 Tax=Alteromonas sp. 1_MG-2023 TaxID=3062669 RepID=UPI0026E24E7F|nr:oxygen-independent coproporphyrinogen III oxidase [Alteromonas sp. 1_MG-2023]MDO6569212.1 oxygen-independent coproporphyrinogen III oxidase [Alteromonas sp. 1_MG-2023]
MNSPIEQATTTITKYAQQAPRYTSYPTALKFEAVNDDLLENASEHCGADTISLYIHIPFCEKLCYYCGCNKIVTRHNEKADHYLSYIEKEMVAKKSLYKHKKVLALHLGGGSPSFLSVLQHTYLMYLIRKHFLISADAEFSIELDPRNVNSEYLQGLHDLGYTRVSFGVQDINVDVQQSINRVQSTAHIAQLVFDAKNIGFSSVNLDLIYGLPKQTMEKFRTTVVAVKAMSPDRISLFSYAHLPDRFASQRKIPQETLPTPDEKAALHQMAVDSFTKTGFEMIGLDHFAKSGDALAVAKHNHVLHRNFQGYTTHKNSDLLGLGVSAISTIGNAYGQNPKQLQDYYSRLDNETSLTANGVALTLDDRIRRDVIMSLMCNLYLDKQDIEEKYDIKFNGYFCVELSSLKSLVDDGIIELSERYINVPDKSRIYIRAICARFDAYLNKDHHISRYSAAI